MKKRDLFNILLRLQLLCFVALLFVGCSHDDDFFPMEEVVYQADTTSVADSVEVSANDTTSVQGRQRIYHLPLRSALTSVKFDAGVSSYE